MVSFRIFIVKYFSSCYFYVKIVRNPKKQRVLPKVCRNIDEPFSLPYNEDKPSAESRFPFRTWLFYRKESCIMKLSLFKNGLCGSTLKITAMFFMLIDHTGAVLVLRIIRALGGTTSMTPEAYQTFMSEYSWLVTLYDCMRLAGRLAFPLFCFLLVEGFLHTRHLARYLFSLGLFALISDPCFDLALNGTPADFSSQNVFFTLFLGLLAMWGIRQIETCLPSIPASAAWLLKCAVLVLGAAAAWLLKTDYGAYGVFCIGLMYLFRAHRGQAFIFGCIPLVLLSDSQLFSFFALPLVLAYNGKRGFSLKYFFYGFYPVHLLFLYLLCTVLGIA